MNDLTVLPPLAGDADSFARWWGSQGEWVEAPNLRRNGESGVQRLRLRDSDAPALYCKRQSGHLYRSLLHPFGRPTVLREQQALKAFERLGVRVPHLLYCAAQKTAGEWRALLVTEALEGFVSLEDWYHQRAHALWGEAIHRQMLHKLGLALSRLHRAGWQHSSCYPKHLFIKVHGRGALAWVEIALLDLEKSRRRWRASAASRHDLGQLYRHRQAMPLADLALFQAAYDEAFTS